MITIAVLSDTHGLLRTDIPNAIKDVDHIIHAGDLGKMEILDELSGIAPTSIVRGNVDTGAWAASLPYNTIVDIPGHPLYILHDIDTLDLAPRAAGFAAIASRTIRRCGWPRGIVRAKKCSSNGLPVSPRNRD